LRWLANWRGDGLLDFGFGIGAKIALYGELLHPEPDKQLSAGSRNSGFIILPASCLIMRGVLWMWMQPPQV